MTVMTSRLAEFWCQLETNFVLGGARRTLRELVGDDVEFALERAGVLVHLRVATVYPCPRPGGRDCPRIVRQRDDGSVVARCGSRSAQCDPLQLTAQDVDFLSVRLENLAAAVGKALQMRVRFEELTEIRDGYCFGTFIPEPGVKHAVYFLACCGDRDYGMAIDSLRIRATGRTLAILVPTDRFLSENLRQRTAAAGIALISLVDVVGLDDAGTFQALVPPLEVFAGAGRAPIGDGDRSAAPAYVAHALIREPDRAPSWRRLDAAGYQRLVAAAASYDVVADELTKTVVKDLGQERIANVPTGYFKWIRAALEKRRHYDPGASDDDGVAAKQLFQRARHVFDLKRSVGWIIFQTEIVESHAVYNFAPQESVTFAFVFLAGSGGQASRSSAEDEQTPLEILMPRQPHRRPGL